MLERAGADGRVVVAERTPLVVLILKQVRIDGADLHAVVPCEFRDGLRVLTGLKIPEYVDGDGRAAAGQSVNLAGISELVVGVDGRGVLEKFTKTGAGIGETPRGRFDLEGGKRLDGAAEKFGGHRRKLPNVVPQCQRKKPAKNSDSFDYSVSVGGRGKRRSNHAPTASPRLSKINQSP